MTLRVTHTAFAKQPFKFFKLKTEYQYPASLASPMTHLGDAMRRGDMERYGDNLSKELPRIPCVSTAADFWAFSQAGRKLADLHLNYETVDPYPVTVTGDTGSLSPAQYRVDKMKYGKKGKEKDLATIHYNALITVSGIPLEAYEYVVNGRSAIDWVVERQCFKVDDGKNGSGLVSDANQWATETAGNARYPLDLLMRVIRVGAETTAIVKSLPKLAADQMSDQDKHE